MNDKLFDNFTREVFKMEPINIIGLSKIFGVKITNDEENALRPVEEIIADLFNGFNKLSSTKKKEILKLCKYANRR